MSDSLFAGIAGFSIVALILCFAPVYPTLSVGVGIVLTFGILASILDPGPCGTNHTGPH